MSARAYQSPGTVDWPRLVQDNRHTDIVLGRRCVHANCNVRKVLALARSTLQLQLLAGIRSEEDHRPITNACKNVSDSSMHSRDGITAPDTTVFVQFVDRSLNLLETA